MFIMDGLVVNWKAVAEFFLKKHRALSRSMSAATSGIMTAYLPQLEGRFCVESTQDKVAHKYKLYNIKLMM